MPSAQKSILFDVIMYMVYLWIIVTVITFMIGLLTGRSCCGGPANAYEHFQDVNTIDTHLYSSIVNMSATFDGYTQKLENIINETANMKSQTCSIYQGVYTKFVKSVASDVADATEFQLSKRKQEALRANRAKNAETTWLNKIEMYKFRHKESAMLNCSQINVTESGDPLVQEDFKDYTLEGPIAPTTIENALQNLQSKFSVFAALLESRSVQQWLEDCRALKGTANFLNMYIHNILIQAQLDKCKEDYIKNIKDFKNKSAEDQEDDTKRAEFVCNVQYGSKFENFENPPYVNTQFSFPVPFPTQIMSSLQRGGYTILSTGQNLLNTFSTKVGTTYQDAMAAYRRMNDTNNAYIQYKKQIDSVSEKNYTQEQAQSFNS